MASDFQRRKIATVFDAMDTDGDDHLVEGDFLSVTERWTAIRHCEPGSPEHELIRSILMGWWSALQAVADANHDNRVSFDELMVLVDQLDTMSAEVLATADAMFNAIDANGDGEIAPAEHAQVLLAWKGSDDGAAEVFPRLDLNGDGHISREEFREMWAEFWHGNDETAAGRWLFGPYPDAR